MTAVLSQLEESRKGDQVELRKMREQLTLM